MKIKESIVNSLASLFLSIVKHYLKDALLAVYFYGSIMTTDFTVTSDIDFIVLLKYFPNNTIMKIQLIHDTVCAQHPLGDRLEGGYHMVSDGLASGYRQGVWVENVNKISMCYMEVEPDSVDNIIENGWVIYGEPIEYYIQKPDKTMLTQFSKKYLIDFKEKLPERMCSDKRFFSAILNACRSICYLEDGLFPSKKVAATYIGERYPMNKQILEKAVLYREGKLNLVYDEKDIKDAVMFIDTIVQLIINEEDVEDDKE